jgi:HSP20 family molecular chaperone IbpA
MKEKIELKNSPAPGFAEGIRDFLKLLEEMESKKEKVRNVSGELEGPFGSKAAYDYTVKLGTEENDLRDFHPRSRSRIRSIKPEPEGEAQEQAIEVFEEDDCVSVVAYLPHIREEDIELNIANNDLKITARTAGGRLVKNIRVSEEKNIQGIKEASFKNGILTIKLGKEKNKVR